MPNGDYGAGYASDQENYEPVADADVDVGSGSGLGLDPELDPDPGSGSDWAVVIAANQIRLLVGNRAEAFLLKLLIHLRIRKKAFESD
jgi:hypothetical protein